MKISRLISGFVLLFILACPVAYAENHGEVININTADAQTIASAMKGVGLKRAMAIVDYREQNGMFESIDDLVRVKGIGPKTLEANRDNLMLEDPNMQDNAKSTSE